MEIKIFESFQQLDEKIYKPSFQRDIDLNRVQSIKEYICERKLKEAMICLGCIDLCKFNGDLYCIDGQHRLLAYEHLYRENNLDIDIYAIVYTVVSIEEMKEIFIIRNMGVPVPDYITNPPVGKGELLKSISNYLLDVPLFTMGNGKSRIDRPQVNLPKFMDYLIDSSLLRSCDSLEEFIELFIAINAKLKLKRYDSAFRKKLQVTDSMVAKIIDKCSKFSFPVYMGMYKDYSEFDNFIL